MLDCDIMVGVIINCVIICTPMGSCTTSMWMLQHIRNLCLSLRYIYKQVTIIIPYKNWINFNGGFWGYGFCLAIPRTFKHETLWTLCFTDKKNYTWINPAKWLKAKARWSTFAIYFIIIHQVWFVIIWTQIAKYNAEQGVTPTISHLHALL